MNKLIFSHSVKAFDKRLKIKTVFYSLLLLTLFSCASSLAPQYNQSIVDNLSKVTKETMQILATVSSGSKASDFGNREAGYNSVLGTLDALKLQLQSRPSPNNKILDKILKKVNERLRERKLEEINGINPSLKAIEQITANVIKMKEVDKVQGITAFEASAFKGGITLFFDQALTYEAFLNK
jgi:hypothetical protein